MSGERRVREKSGNVSYFVKTGSFPQKHGSVEKVFYNSRLIK